MSALPTTFFGWVGFILDKYGTLFLSGVGVTLLVAITGTVIGFRHRPAGGHSAHHHPSPRATRGASVCPSRCFPRC